MFRFGIHTLQDRVRTLPCAYVRWMQLAIRMTELDQNITSKITRRERLT